MSGALSIVIVTCGICLSGRALSFCEMFEDIGRPLLIDSDFHDGRDFVFLNIVVERDLLYASSMHARVVDSWSREFLVCCGRQIP